MNKNELITVCDDFDKINTEFNKFFAELNEVIFAFCHGYK